MPLLLGEVWSSIMVQLKSGIHRRAVGCHCVRPSSGLARDSDFSFFRVLRVYGTQKKRVVFNISKMLSGQGPEGEVGSAYHYLWVHMCVCVLCVHTSVSLVCVYAWMCVCARVWAHV